MNFIFLEFKHFSHKTAASAHHDKWLLDLELITTLQQYNILQDRIPSLYRDNVVRLEAENAKA
jgi:hypothetical protein